MMDCTDRHFRYLIRLVTRHTLLYTEMVTSAALVHGRRDHLLDFSEEEHPIALQLGGSDPASWPGAPASRRTAGSTRST